jgi:mono/diheme cytochrome c family protein
MNSNCIHKKPWRVASAVLGSILLLQFNRAACAGEANEVYLKNCAACHGKDGKAQTSVAKKLGVKDLTQSRITDAQIEKQIQDGKPASQSAAKMPAFKDRLTAEEIKSLIAVVREFRK